MAPLNQTTVPSSILATTTIYLPPSSPLFTYSPDIPGMNVTGVWRGVEGTPAARSGSGGWGNFTGRPGDSASQSNDGGSRQTPGNSALMLSDVHLTSFTPFFDPIPGYSSALKSSPASPPEPWSSNQTYSQPFGPSTLVFSVACADPTACPSTPFTFRGGHLESQIAPPAMQGAAETKNAIADDASGLIQYTGWAPIAKDNTIVVAGPRDYAGTLSMTANANASAVVRFRGTAILLRGVTAPPLGKYTINLDTSRTKVYNAQDDIITHDVPLFFASALDGSAVHTMTLTTLSETGSGVGAVIDRVEIWGPEGGVGFIGGDGNLVMPPISNIVPPYPFGSGPNPSTGGTVPGANLPGATTGGALSAGAIVGIIIGVLAGLTIAYWFFRKYGSPPVAKPASNSVNKWDAANNLQAMKQEAVLVTTVANQRYVYPGMIAHSDLK